VTSQREGTVPTRCAPSGRVRPPRRSPGRRAAARAHADGAVVGGDGRHRLDGDGDDRLSAPGRDVDYRLAPAGAQRSGRSAARSAASNPARSGARCGLLELGWLRRADRGRAVHVTDLGRRSLRDELGVRL
jgi:hypothetical protein